jgi:hypothetical protein
LAAFVFAFAVFDVFVFCAKAKVERESSAVSAAVSILFMLFSCFEGVRRQGDGARS